MILGALFNEGVEELTTGKDFPANYDHKLVGRSCFIAAFLYGAVFLLCSCQVNSSFY